MSKRKRRTEKFKKNRPTRRCHDCGRPTSNYRCKECWKKLRREGKYVSTGDIVELGFGSFLKNTKFSFLL